MIVKILPSFITLRLFQTCMHFFHLPSTKEDILKNEQFRLQLKITLTSDFDNAFGKRVVEIKYTLHSTNALLSVWGNPANVSQ